jgi:hypothetical protein
MADDAATEAAPPTLPVRSARARYVPCGQPLAPRFLAVVERPLSHRLEPIIPGVRQRFLGADISRTRMAYAIFLNEYEAAH